MKLAQKLKVIIALLIVMLLITVSWNYFSLQRFFTSTDHYQFIQKAGDHELLEQQATSSIKLLFVGDMMFDRYIRKMALKYGEDSIISCIDPLLSKHDFVVGNLEGPITGKPSTSMDTKVGSPENYYFTFPTSTAALLFRHNIKLVSIGNNHINNQKSDGITQTKKFLSDAHVAYFGGLAGDASVYRTVEQGVPLSFVNYNQFGGEKEEMVAATIATEKSQGRTVIVYAHWGEEYQDVVLPIRLTAKLFAESGADLIIGSHPHIVQSHEKIGRTLVYYSLGNFIFDQYFDSSVMEGLAVSVEISSGHVTNVREYNVKMKKDGSTCLSENDASNKI